MKISGILHDFAALAAGHFVAKTIGFIAAMVLARLLKLEDLGVYAVLLTGLGYMQAIANWGTDALGIRYVSVEPGVATSTEARIARIRLTVGAIVVLGAVMLGYIYQVPKQVLLPLCLCIAALAYRRDWLWLAGRNSRGVGFALVLRELVFILCVLGVVGTQRTLASVMWAVLVAEICWSITTWALSRSGEVSQEGVGSPSMTRLVREGLPIAIVSVTVLTTNKVDVPLLAQFRSQAEVAAYWGAYNLMFGAMALAALFTRAALPEMSRQANYSRESGSAHTFRLAVLAGIAGCIVSLGLAVLSRQAMDLVYARRLSEGAQALQILALGLPGHFLAAVLVGRLVAEGRQSHWTAAAVTAAVVNVGLNLVLIPRLGIQGAAWATVVSEWAICSVVLTGFRNHSLHRPLVLNAIVMASAFGLAALALIPFRTSLGPLAVVTIISVSAAIFATLVLRRVPSALQLSVSIPEKA